MTAAAPMSESVWQKAVVELAETCGWTVNHCYRGKVSKGAWRTNTTVKGYPDLHLWRPGESLMAELKTDRGALSVEQCEVLAQLTAAGVECHVWAPRDWDAVIKRLNR